MLSEKVNYRYLKNPLKHNNKVLVIQHLPPLEISIPTKITHITIALSVKIIVFISFSPTSDFPLNPWLEGWLSHMLALESVLFGLLILQMYSKSHCS